MFENTFVSSFTTILSCFPVSVISSILRGMSEPSTIAQILKMLYEDKEIVKRPKLRALRDDVFSALHTCS